MDPLTLSIVAGANLAGSGLQAIGAFQQAKHAKRALQFQRDQYNDWNRWRKNQGQLMQSAIRPYGLLGRNNNIEPLGLLEKTQG